MEQTDLLKAKEDFCHFIETVHWNLLCNKCAPKPYETFEAAYRDALLLKRYEHDFRGLIVEDNMQESIKRVTVRAKDIAARKGFVLNGRDRCDTNAETTGCPYYRPKERKNGLGRFCALFSPGS